MEDLTERIRIEFNLRPEHCHRLSYIQRDASAFLEKYGNTSPTDNHDPVISNCVDLIAKLSHKIVKLSAVVSKEYQSSGAVMTPRSFNSGDIHQANKAITRASLTNIDWAGLRYLRKIDEECRGRATLGLPYVRAAIRINVDFHRSEQYLEFKSLLAAFLDNDLARALIEFDDRNRGTLSRA